MLRKNGDEEAGSEIKHESVVDEKEPVGVSMQIH
jgi:hypothetical protein